MQTYDTKADARAIGGYAIPGTANAVQSRDQPREQSEVEEQSMRLDRAISMLAVTLKQHRDRVQPIVRPMPPKPESADKVRGLDHPMSAMGEALRAAVRQVEQLAYELSELTDSLAV